LATDGRSYASFRVRENRELFVLNLGNKSVPGGCPGEEFLDFVCSSFHPFYTRRPRLTPLTGGERKDGLRVLLHHKTKFRNGKWWDGGGSYYIGGCKKGIVRVGSFWVAATGRRKAKSSEKGG